MKVSELSNAQLDYWVARGRQIELLPDPQHEEGFLYRAHASLPPRRWQPSRLWSQGGPIIETSHIDLNWDWEQSGEWTASLEPDINAQGSSALEAAMRAYVISVFGETISP